MPGPFFPTLVLTADATPDAKHQALAGGATHFITKPLDLAEVILRVGNLLDTRSLHIRLAGFLLKVVAKLLRP